MADVIRAIVKGHLAGVVQTRMMFTGHVTLGGTETYPQVARGYVDAIMLDLQPALSTVASFETIQVQKQSGSTWIDLEEVVYGMDGSNVSNPLPNAVAGVLIGNAGGNRQIGRKFIPGLAESVVSGNGLIGVGITAFAAALLDYVTQFTSIGGSAWVPGIVTKDGVFREFLSGYVSSLLGSMRRRKPGLGI